VPIFWSRTPGCWTHRTIVPNTKALVTEWWAVQAYGATLHRTTPWNELPFFGTGSQAVGPPSFRKGGPKLRA
jgi:hypothetical protein